MSIIVFPYFLLLQCGPHLMWSGRFFIGIEKTKRELARVHVRELEHLSGHPSRAG